MTRLSLQAARRLGRTRYFTGRECKRGHIAPHLVSTQGCVECHNLRARRRQKAHPEKNSAKMRSYAARNKKRMLMWFRKWRRKNYARVMVVCARKRAKARRVPFSITHRDISIPLRCPILGIRLQKNGVRGGPASPTLDRLVPRRGYVKGNIAVISHRANRIKSDGTAKEHLAIASWMRLRANS